MKKLIIFTLFLFICSITKSQMININPDPNGPEWLVGSLPENDQSIEALWDSFQFLILSDESELCELPILVDNTTQPYMRGPFGQEDGCCGQASGIGYTYTYEINRLRNNEVLSEDDIYPTHFIHNILREYSDGELPGAYCFQGWELMKETGCPNVTDYGGEIIELSECEKGAFLVVDSYGVGFGDEGFIYVPYKLMDEGLVLQDCAYTCNVIESEPEVTIKTSVEHDNRKDLVYMVGYAEDAIQTDPIDFDYYEIFKKQGGEHSFRINMDDLKPGIYYYSLNSFTGIIS